MRLSIFQIHNKNSYRDEYHKIIKVLVKPCVFYDNNNYSYFDFIDTYLFNNWKYRGTFLDCDSYLKFIGVNLSSKKITEDAFLNLLEFLLNIQLLFESIKKFHNKVMFSDVCQSILFHNIPLLIENMGYFALDIDDKVCLFKRDINYEDLFEMVPDSLKELLYSYNCSINNGIKMKKIILNKIYNIMLKDEAKYKELNSGIFQSIKIVITKMGVIGDINKKYSGLSSYKIKKYYDYCFKMMCFLFSMESVYKYKDEIKKEAV